MAPPTLLDLTSTVGFILLIAWLNTVIGSSFDLIGVDVVRRIMKNLADKDASFYLADCLEQAVKCNLLGKKNRTSIRQLFN